jgi:hypothetical protein
VLLYCVYFEDATRRVGNRLTFGVTF